MLSNFYFSPLTRKTLCKVLPSNVKRLIFISSITGYLRGIQTPQSALVERLNKLMNIGTRSNSLLFPIFISSSIWSDFDPVKKLKEKGLDFSQVINSEDNHVSMKDLRILSNVVIENSPEFLRYGSKKEMRGDLIHLFKNINGLQPV